MKTSPKLIVAMLAAPLAIGLAAPASAQDRYDRGYDRYEHQDVRDYRDDRRDRYRDRRAHRGFERRIDELANETRHSIRSGALTRWQARNMQRKIRSIRYSYRSLSRDGLSRHDRWAINSRIREAYASLRRSHVQNSRHYDNDYRYRNGYRSARY